MEKLTETVKDMARCLGAVEVGIATLETLDGGPPSTDLSYVLPEAKSAVCFALPLNQAVIEPYLRKEDHDSHQLDNIRTNTLASGISLEMAKFLDQIGHPSVPQAANLDYRTDAKHGPYSEKPPISHRYLAVRSGIGHFGYSGNVLSKDYGAAIILGTVVTTAELMPTDPLPATENYCDDCKLCNAVCASGYMVSDEKSGITIGGVDFSHCQKRHHMRCDYVCGGFSGLHRSGQWSTWSPARYPIPENDKDLKDVFMKAAVAYNKRKIPAGGFYHFLMPGYKIEFTCGNCQLVCHPEKEVRKQRHQMLAKSGVVIQHPDGSRTAVSPQEAEKHIARMKPEIRMLYEES